MHESPGRGPLGPVRLSLEWSNWHLRNPKLPVNGIRYAGSEWGVGPLRSGHTPYVETDNFHRYGVGGSPDAHR